MEIRRLAWAGLEVNADGETAVVDFVEDFSWMHSDDPPAGEIPPSPASGTAVAGLLTHLHWDHADVDALGHALGPGAVVLRPEKSFGGEAEVALIDKPESALEESGLNTRVVKPWETIEIGPFRFTALPAADGFRRPTGLVVHRGQRVSNPPCRRHALSRVVVAIGAPPRPVRRGLPTRRWRCGRSSFAPAGQPSVSRHGSKAGGGGGEAARCTRGRPDPLWASSRSLQLRSVRRPSRHPLRSCRRTRHRSPSASTRGAIFSPGHVVAYEGLKVALNHLRERLMSALRS
jgi:hypothetical protein